MKKNQIVLFLLTIIWTTELKAQDFFIDFTGYGASSTVSSIKVSNINQGTSITIDGNKVLHLKNVIDGIASINEDKNRNIQIYPNPTTDYSYLQFDLPEGGRTTIDVYDISGRKILEKQEFLFTGQHTYKIQNLNKGIYIISISTDKYLTKGKLFSISSGTFDPDITYINTIISNGTNKDKSLKHIIGAKGGDSDTTMQYNTGDLLILKGSSDTYNTIVPDIPISSKTISFDFIPCFDADNNNYAVVMIGNQVWMAENLRTTKYSDGTAIPNISEPGVWKELRTPGYSWYNNEESAHKSIDGALYNWYTVNTIGNGGKNICPTGWHVPSEIEWMKLTDYLGGGEVAGGKLKEAGTSDWHSETVWIPGTNESGFTGIPGGMRNYDGLYDGLGYGGFWWCSTEYSSENGIALILSCSNSGVGRDTYSSHKPAGYSVRCISDESNKLPVISTSEINSITSTSARSGGIIISEGGAAITALGVCWSTSANPTIVSRKTSDILNMGSFSSLITDLTRGTTYYLRAYATNIFGTSYGNQLIFVATSLPSLTTTEYSSVTQNSVISGGNITFDGGESVSERGICWSETTNPTIADTRTIDGSGSGYFTSSLTGLSLNTKYFLRAYATNSSGTSYGGEISFKTFSGTVTDVDGNMYFTVIIGNQNWMAENLKVTRYSDGTPITLANSPTKWDSLTYLNKAYCWYGDNISNKSLYGAIYNWAGAMNGELNSYQNPSGVQGVCPVNWHLPSDDEWKQLASYLGGSSQTVGGQLKQKGLSNWQYPNTNATNESGFSALPGGTREFNRQCYGLGQNGFWWSATEGEYRYLGFDTSSFDSSYDRGTNGFTDYGLSKKHGFSVRCLKD